MIAHVLYFSVLTVYVLSFEMKDSCQKIVFSLSHIYNSVLLNSLMQKITFIFEKLYIIFTRKYITSVTMYWYQLNK